jgi:DNA-directed RNA polymerase subunit RPC12/RpoP
MNRDKHKAYRCHRCGKSLDTSINPEPKRLCEFCGSGRWEEVRVLTLDESFTLYKDYGVVFLNDDDPIHQGMLKRLTERGDSIDAALKDDVVAAKKLWDDIAEEARQEVAQRAIYNLEKPGE